MPSFIEIEDTFCGRTDGRAGGHLRPTLLGVCVCVCVLSDVYQLLMVILLLLIIFCICCEMFVNIAYYTV